MRDMEVVPLARRPVKWPDFMSGTMVAVVMMTLSEVGWFERMTDEQGVESLIEMFVPLALEFKGQRLTSSSSRRYSYEP